MIYHATCTFSTTERLKTHFISKTNRHNDTWVDQFRNNLTYHFHTLGYYFDFIQHSNFPSYIHSSKTMASIPSCGSLMKFPDGFRICARESSITQRRHNGAFAKRSPVQHEVPRAIRVDIFIGLFAGNLLPVKSYGITSFIPIKINGTTKRGGWVWAAKTFDNWKRRFGHGNDRKNVG